MMPQWAGVADGNDGIKFRYATDIMGAPYWVATRGGRAGYSPSRNGAVCALLNNTEGARHMTPVSRNVLTAINELLRYNWDDEERNCEEHPSDDGQSHIFNRMQLIRDWLHGVM